MNGPCAFFFFTICLSMADAKEGETCADHTDCEYQTFCDLDDSECKRCNTCPVPNQPFDGGACPTDPGEKCEKRTCADTQADKSNVIFDCSTSDKDLDPAIKCGQDPCNANECCIVDPPIIRCNDANGDGTAEDDVDCGTKVTCADEGDTGFTCTCDAGYAGNTTSNEAATCTAITCADANGNGDPADCGTGATCADDALAGYTCSCDAGFEGNTTSNEAATCNDIDECSTDADDCDTNADCTNTDGSYTCSCKSLFNGDGKTCTACKKASGRRSLDALKRLHGFDRHLLFTKEDANGGKDLPVCD